MKVSDVVKALETLAPPSLSAKWDNVGLLVGDAGAEARKVLLCIDLTPQVLAEAAKVKAQMVMAYHPVIFKGVSRLTADASPAAYEAARRGLAVYSMHTALDAAPGGTNDVLAEVLGLAGHRPLEPVTEGGSCKIVIFVPPADLSRVAEAAFAAGAGRIGRYYDCAFFAHGIGAFCGGEGSNPTVGHVGRHEVTEEVRLEMVAPKADVPAVCAAARAAHSYEEPVIDVYPLEGCPDERGMGRVGRLARPATAASLIARVKRATRLKNVLVAGGGESAGRADRRARKAGSLVKIAACSAGSAGSMYQAAAKAGATFFLTGEMHHHDALAATAAGMTVVCLGHSNSERITLPRLARRLGKLLPGLAVLVSQRDKDPFRVA